MSFIHFYKENLEIFLIALLKLLYRSKDIHQFMCRNSDDRKNSKSSNSMTHSGPTERFILRRNNQLCAKQKRLLLLHHASKCPYEEGSCPLGSRCTELKQLWQHVKTCKAQDCDVPHCISSRFILTHYRHCKSHRCRTCLPVREIIKRQKEKREQCVRAEG